MLLYGFKSKENIKILDCELVIQRLTEIKEFMHKIYTKKYAIGTGDDTAV